MIVFASRTGNVRSIVSKLQLPSCEITDDLVMSQPYILFTYTDGLGDVPERVLDFLSVDENKYYLKGVIASGNVNFGMRFCGSADEISNNHNVPIIRKIDLRGTQEDINIIKKYYINHMGCEEN